MPPTEIYALTREERDALRQVLATWKQQRANTEQRSEVAFEEGYQAPEVYVARTPDDGILALSEVVTTDPSTDPAGGFSLLTGFPGFSLPTLSATSADEVPGQADCDIYKVVLQDGEPVLSPVPGLTQTVYNINAAGIPGGIWALVQRDKFGQWYASTGGASPWLQATEDSFTEDVNDWLPASGLLGTGNLIERISADAESFLHLGTDAFLTGTVAPTGASQLFPLLLWNVDSTPIVLTHEDSGSQATNRFLLGNGFSVTKGCVLTGGSAVVTGLDTTSGLSVGLSVYGSGVPVATYVSSVDSDTQITLTNPVHVPATGTGSDSGTGTGSESLTFTGGQLVLNQDSPWAICLYDLTTQRYRVYQPPGGYWLEVPIFMTAAGGMITLPPQAANQPVVLIIYATDGSNDVIIPNMSKPAGATANFPVMIVAGNCNVHLAAQYYGAVTDGSAFSWGSWGIRGGLWTGATLTDGSSSITGGVGIELTSIAPGMIVTDSGRVLPRNTFVKQVFTETSIEITQSVSGIGTGSGSGTAEYDLNFFDSITLALTNQPLIYGYPDSALLIYDFDTETPSWESRGAWHVVSPPQRLFTGDQRFHFPAIVSTGMDATTKASKTYAASSVNFDNFSGQILIQEFGVYGESGVLVTLGDLTDCTYTATTATDWASDAPPITIGDALDRIAAALTALGHSP